METKHKWFVPLRQTGLRCVALTLLVIGLAWVLGFAARDTNAATKTWSNPYQLSAPPITPNGSFPRIAIDAMGKVHTVWYTVIRQKAKREISAIDSLTYRVLESGSWSESRAIFFTGKRPIFGNTDPRTGEIIDGMAEQNVIQSALAIGRDGQLHIAFSSVGKLFYTAAPTNQAVNITTVSEPQPIGADLYSDLAASNDGTLHITFNHEPEDEGQIDHENCQFCLEVWYRRSIDGGSTWSRPMNISRVTGDDNQQQLRADSQNRLHLVWDHSPKADAETQESPLVLYRRSVDGGKTWQDTIALGLASEGVVQGTLGVSLEGNPLVVYRSASNQQIYYQSSSDGGATWSSPGLIPTVRGRAASDTNLDNYSLAVDGSNHLHLLVVGFLPGDTSQIPKLLHLTWDGQSWSAPNVIMEGSEYPEHPQLAIERGNRLHAIWFTREDSSGPSRDNQTVWYSSLSLDGPELVPPATFTPISQPTAIQPTATVAIIPTTISLESRSMEIAEGPPSWEGRALLTLLIALVPVLFLVIVVIRKNTAPQNDESD